MCNGVHNQHPGVNQHTWGNDPGAEDPGNDTVQGAGNDPTVDDGDEDDFDYLNANYPEQTGGTHRGGRHNRHNTDDGGDGKKTHGCGGHRKHDRPRGTDEPAPGGNDTVTGNGDDDEGDDPVTTVPVSNNGSGAPVISADLYTPTKTGDPQMDQWDDAIMAASKATGLPANYIKATIYAESRGNPNESSTNPDGIHSDVGLMQISTATYYGDANSDITGIVDIVSNAPKNLDLANNPADNIMAGAFELKAYADQFGGDLNAASARYVGHGDSTDAAYAKAVLEMKADLDAGRPLKDEYGNF